MKQYLAIDIGGTAVKLGIVDETGAVGPKAEESVNFDGYQTPVPCSKPPKPLWRPRTST